ncbi:hypothetical protein [Candidatus Dactylopiibacterium carminicum]|uniref:hypothetical protein n=1 Tax=Candidatus Dactylopiibacterium carminicum TaxID=857335 RepID=UPI00148214BA|nr:hypothetical protein [Candidatus Dactylopiibacterium carminicum]
MPVFAVLERFVQISVTVLPLTPLSVNVPCLAEVLLPELQIPIPLPLYSVALAAAQLLPEQATDSRPLVALELAVLAELPALDELRLLVAELVELDEAPALELLLL